MQQWLLLAFSLCLLLALTACNEQETGAKVESAASNPAADGSKQTAATLKLAFATALPGLDPLRAGSHESNMLIGAVYDRLYRYALLARPYQILPQAALDMPVISADGRHYRIAMRDDLRFHSHIDLPASVEQGRPVQASDVVYSLLRHFDPAQQSPWRWLWAGRIQGLDAWGRNGADYQQPPAGLQVAADGSLHITLTSPQADFLHLLAHPSAAIVMREVVQQHGPEYGLHAVGSGPYRLRELSLSKITLEPVADYRSDPLSLSAEGYLASLHAQYGLAALAQRSAPLLSGIRIQIERSAEQRLQLLRAGQIDALLLMSDQYPEVLAQADQDADQDTDAEANQEMDQASDGEADATSVALDPMRLTADWSEHWQTHRQASAEWLRIDFNLHPQATAADSNARAAIPLALRCAMRDSIDWHSFNQRFYHGTGYVSDSVIAPAVTGSTVAAAAKGSTAGSSTALAGMATQPDLIFAYVDSRRNRAHFDWFRQQLSDAGYSADLIGAETFEHLGALLQSYREQQWPLLFAAWSLDLPTATNTLQLYAGNNAHVRSGGPGLANYRNAEYDQLLRQLSSQTGDDPALEQRLLALLARDCVVSSGFSPARIHIWRKDLLAWPDADFAAAEWLRFAALAENQHNE